MDKRRRVPLESTQPDADDLVSYRDLAFKLERLRGNPRISVRSVGKSHEGRDIFLATISSPENMRSLRSIQDMILEVSSFRGGRKTLSDRKTRPAPRASSLKDVIPSVLLIGASFGHEAAHVEALVRLIEHLAASDEDGVKEILGRMVVLVMPMINPDGRMLAIDEWRKVPLSTGCNGSGNAFGFLLNRDFLHLIHPETQAVLEAFREWEPMCCIDLHEDKVILDVSTPEVCWCPPYVDKPYVKTLPPEIMALVDELGGVIAKEWTRHGYTLMFDPEGKDSLLPIAGLGGRADLTFVHHNSIALITESARTPGSQPWLDRVTQKFAAAMAVLQHLARDTERYLRVVCRAKTTVPPRDRYPVYVIPIEKGDPCGLYRLGVTLDRHGIQYYKTDTPYPAYVVPSEQPKIEIIRTLFGERGEKEQVLLGDFGIAALSLDKLPKKEKAAFESSRLSLVEGHPIPRPDILPAKDGAAPALVFEDSVWGITLANRLLKGGAAVSRAVEDLRAGGRKFSPGTFVAQGISEGALSRLGQGLGISIVSVKAKDFGAMRSLSLPKIALYSGQGVDMQHLVHKADLAWALSQMEFPYIEVGDDQFRGGALSGVDVLIVPAGDAREIAEGRDPNGIWNRYPWEPVGEKRGLGKEGLARIVEFVKAGGTYIGVGAGGGALASQEFSKLMDFHVIDPLPSKGPMLLRLEAPDDPLLWGYDGCYNDAGKWMERVLPTYYYGEKLFGTPASPMMKTGRNARVVATYQRLSPALEFFPDEDVAMSVYQNRPAIVYQEIGRGKAVVFGVNVGFRAIATNTFRLLANAVYH
jgi:hypothetical protein